MITAVDTNILLDVLLNDPAHADSSEGVLEQAYDEGALVISEVVYAELAPRFQNQSQLDRVLQELNVDMVAAGADVAFLAGKKWSEYRRSGGTRARLLADFLIGAHAQLRAERFLTRDRGFYRSYFADLVLLEP